jgi:transcription elongation factor Elf1
MSRARDTRQQRAVERFECPRCHARPGTVCYVRGKPGKSYTGPACHPERRKLLRVVIDPPAPEVLH